VPIKNNWFYESLSESASLTLKVDELLYHQESEYQDVLVFRNNDYGTVLVLDDALMLSDKDEHMYHKAITHYGVSNCNPDKKLNVLVVGAGDGGVVRDLLTVHSNRVQRVTMVEIDQVVIDVSKKFFPKVSSHLNDPRLDLKVQDALKYIDSAIDDSFDLVICDSTDPVGFAAGLIEEDFYKKIQRVLCKDGIFIAQSGSKFFMNDELEKARSNLAKVFADVHTYYSPMLVYPGVIWSYTAAGAKLLNKKNLDISEFMESKSINLVSK
jgi:spermidine synthase